MNNSYHILTEQIEAALKQYLEIPDCPQKTVYQAMYEAVNAGGKRLPPGRSEYSGFQRNVRQTGNRSSLLYDENRSISSGRAGRSGKKILCVRRCQYFRKMLYLFLFYNLAALMSRNL